MSASFRITGLSLGCLLGGLSWCLAVEGLPGGKTNQLLEIRSLSVNRNFTDPKRFSSFFASQVA